MTKILPFFGYYGSKHRLARHYPPPRHQVVIEACAGSAGYACHYPDRQVILVERAPHVAEIWRYLLRVSPEEILRLPDLRLGQDLRELRLTPEQVLLIGHWTRPALPRPSYELSEWSAAADPRRTAAYWGDAVRRRIARQLPAIRHWRLIEGDYTDAPDVRATWYVDPP